MTNKTASKIRYFISYAHRCGFGQCLIESDSLLTGLSHMEKLRQEISRMSLLNGNKIKADNITILNIIRMPI